LPRKRPITDSLSDDQKVVYEALKKPWYKEPATLITIIAAVCTFGFWVLEGRFQTIKDANATQKENESFHAQMFKDTKLLVEGLIESVRENSKQNALQDKEDFHQNEALKRLERKLNKLGD